MALHTEPSPVQQRPEAEIEWPYWKRNIRASAPRPASANTRPPGQKLETTWPWAVEPLSAHLHRRVLSNNYDLIKLYIFAHVPMEVGA